MADKLVTDLTSLSSPATGDLVHVVDISDTTDSSGGTSKKSTLQVIANWIISLLTKSDVGLGNVDNTSDATKNSATATLTNKTLTSPKINEDVAVTATATEINLLSGQTSLGSSESFMNRQAIINGNFDVWQRGTSTSISDVTTTFQADRWLDYADKSGGTLPTLTRSRQTQTAGALQGSYFFSRLTTNGAGTSLGSGSLHQYQQRIEHGTRLLSGDGKKVTVSFWAKSDIANKRMAVSLGVNYGTGGSPTAEGNATGTKLITLTSTWTQYTQTFTMPTLAGKTFGTANDDFLKLIFWNMWGSAFVSFIGSTTAETYVGSGNIDIAQVQLCAGDVALPFQPKSFEEELRSCQRYYEASADRHFIISGNVTSGSTYYGSVNYQVKKRSAVNPVISNVDRINFPSTAPTLDVGSIDTFYCHLAANGTGVGALAVGYTVDAEL